MKVVILAWWTWTRLWPFSTKKTPKQFLELYGDKTLIEHTYERAARLAWAKNVFFSTNQQYAQQVEQIFDGKETGWTIVETEKKNTWPAMLLCFKRLFEDYWLKEDEPVVFMPADHIIKPVEMFENYLQTWANHFWSQSITIFWIVPRTPHTWFWYIKAWELLKEWSYAVERFTEKPDYETAAHFLAEWWYYRNSWIYMLSYKVLLQELEKYAPQAVEYMCCEAREDEYFAQLPAISFDCMVAEKTENAVVVPMSVQWSDVWTREALDEISDRSEQWNVVSGDVQITGVANTYVSAQDVNIKVVWVDGLVVVQHGNSILIAKKWKSQDVKELL